MYIYIYIHIYVYIYIYIVYIYTYIYSIYIYIYSIYIHIVYTYIYTPFVVQCLPPNKHGVFKSRTPAAECWMLSFEAEEIRLMGKRPPGSKRRKLGWNLRGISHTVIWHKPQKNTGKDRFIYSILKVHGSDLLSQRWLRHLFSSEKNQSDMYPKQQMCPKMAQPYMCKMGQIAPSTPFLI